MIIRLAEGQLSTKFGTFLEVLYYDGQQELIAIVMGNVQHGQEVLCRLHSHCLAAHVFNSIECDCREQMEIAQALIEQRGRGVIIWLDQEGRGNGHLALLQSRALQEQGMSQSAAYVALGYEADARRYTRAAEILHDLEVKSVQLMTNSPHKVAGLQAAGITIAGTQPLILPPGTNERIRRNYEDKIARGYYINREEL
jgi:3,4-dihydroxy 2-butanone 4-phosphate synthase/GTP cyclohydrolase II